MVPWKFPNWVAGEIYEKDIIDFVDNVSCFYCFAERECNEIPEEYKETKVFKWSKEKHGKEYFEKDNWQWHGEGQFVIQFDAIDTNRMYNFLCETADENPKIFFNNLKKKMGNNMKCFHTSGSGDDKVPYYEITFKD